MSQHMEALTSANAIRIERAATCKAVSTTADAAEVILTCESGLPVRKLLLSIDRWGEGRVERFMEAAGINFYATLGGRREGNRYPLTDRQRREIARLLDPDEIREAA